MNKLFITSLLLIEQIIDVLINVSIHL